MDDFRQESEDPFFVRVDFHGPHMPNVIPEPYASMYDPKEIPPHANFDDDLEGKPAVQAIIKGARTGNIGDGKIFIMDLPQCVRIRTLERGTKAIS